MNDIPIGSPPAPPGRHAAPQGWYPDPVDGSRERYWDGWNWSRNTREPERSARANPVAGPTRPPQPGPAPPPAGQQAAAPLLTQDGVPVAGWGWRLLAGVVDLLIVSIVGLLGALPFLLTFVTRASDYFSESMQAAENGKTTPPVPTDLVTAQEQLSLTVVSAVVGVAYFSIMWRLASATLGQLLCGLRVVPFETGRPVHHLGWGVCLLRASIWWVPLAVGNVLLVCALINALTPLFQSRRQAIHDLAVRTQIVKVK